MSAADLLLTPILAYLEVCPEGPALLQAAPNGLRAQRVMRARRSYLETQPETA